MSHQNHSAVPLSSVLWLLPLMLVVELVPLWKNVTKVLIEVNSQTIFNGKIFSRNGGVRRVGTPIGYYTNRV